jgi:hypothetical protein
MAAEPTFVTGDAPSTVTVIVRPVTDPDIVGNCGTEADPGDVGLPLPQPASVPAASSDTAWQV